jgi:hypothetical protein
VALSLGVKRPGREADHSPPSSADVKKCVELYLHSPNTPSWCGAQFKKKAQITFSNYTLHNVESGMKMITSDKYGIILNDSSVF